MQRNSRILLVKTRLPTEADNLTLHVGTAISARAYYGDVRRREQKHDENRAYSRIFQFIYVDTASDLGLALEDFLNPEP